MKYIELLKIKQTINLEKFLMNVHQFEQMKQELFQEEIFKRQKTLCIDIENVCLRKVEIFDPEEY